MIKNLLLNKNVYGVKYFIKDLSLLKYLNVTDIRLYKIGITRRLDLLFSVDNIKQYNLYKRKCLNETSFLNLTCKNNKFCASFVADKKFDSVLDMIINSNGIGCISKERILELCETLKRKSPATRESSRAYFFNL